MHAKNIGIQTLLLRKSEQSFDTGIVKKFKVQYWDKNFYKTKHV